MMIMKKTFLTLALLTMTVTLLASCGQRVNTNETAAGEAQETAEVTADDQRVELELPDLQGNMLKLSSLRGKYVVLDFWGSWCIWCIRGIPSMKEAYAKHKDKMEILGIDCRDSEAKWKAAVAEHQLPWLQVRCSDDQLPQLADQFQIEGFPTKVVIDPEGRIAKVIVGEDPAFYTYLDELFAK
jgi:thiol-disulfide isomerase/thioredoxin